MAAPRLRLVLVGMLWALLLGSTQATAERPRLALVIDDIGWDLKVGRRVLDLPVPLTVAVLPETPAGPRLATEAYLAGREVILHQPMAAEQGVDAGPGSMVPDMSAAAIVDLLTTNLDQVPHHRGVSNHMGSLLTRCERSMAVIMQALADRGLYFLDSRTTPHTVALQSARYANVPATRRDVFLDTMLDPIAIERALESAIRIAEERGEAIAIGHPHAATLEVLEAQWPRLRERVELVTVSDLVTTPKSTTILHGAAH